MPVIFGIMGIVLFLVLTVIIVVVASKKFAYKSVPKTEVLI